MSSSFVNDVLSRYAFFLGISSTLHLSIFDQPGGCSGRRGEKLKKLIITADDFGLSVEVNKAVEEAFLDGVLTAASLMAGEEAAADAVARAHRLEGLRVGLHLTLVNGRAVLPPEEIPDLVDGSGRFDDRLVRSGFRFFFRPGIRRQLGREIRAQFEAFRRTGLPLDHLNAHCHMHLHPTVLTLALRIGREFGLKAVRVPEEPFSPSLSMKNPGAAVNGMFLAPWCALMKKRLRRKGIGCNDRVFGLTDTGRMDAERFGEFLKNLPPGLTEIYFHPLLTPASSSGKRELEALTDPGNRRLIRQSGISLGGFSDFLPGGPASAPESIS